MTRRRSSDDPFYDGVNWGRPGLARTAEAADQLAALKRTRASGVLHVEFGDRRITYRSDAELTRAIGALEAECNPQRVRNVVCRPTTNKGW